VDHQIQDLDDFGLEAVLFLVRLRGHCFLPGKPVIATPDDSRSRVLALPGSG
jgi:hypothetical protein